MEASIKDVRREFPQSYPRRWRPTHAPTPAAAGGGSEGGAFAERSLRGSAASSVRVLQFNTLAEGLSADPGAESADRLWCKTFCEFLRICKMMQKS